MKSIFELKNSLPFDAQVFERMKKTALELLCGTEKKEYTQAIVLLFGTGREYAAVIENALSGDKKDEKVFTECLASANDTKLNRVLCMWCDGEIDIPSFALRQMLCDVDDSNNDCGIFVMVDDGYSVIKLENTMK